MRNRPADESELACEPPPQHQPPESPSLAPPRPEQLSSESDSRVPLKAAGDTNSSATDDPAVVTLSGAGVMPDLAVHLADEVIEIRLPTSGEISFAVGDLVWGKTKSHLWWPALVSDPSAAPDAVKKAQRRDASLLVSCFGSGASSWCDLSQLKPFVEEFHPMARQSKSKSFIGAVEGALDLVRQRLQLELTCYCISPEARAKNTGVSTCKIFLTNLQPLEFLEHLHNVACDVTLADMLQVQALKSWVMAFGKGWGDGSPGYHPHRDLMELVDKIDLDEPPGGPDDGECWITGNGMGGDTSTSEDNIHENQKKTSMVALIAGMDLDTVELSDADEVKLEEDKVKVVKRRKKFEIDEFVDVDSGEIDAQEDIGSGRRTRKKSKYLSPPYTCLGALTTSPSSPRSAEVKSTKRPVVASHLLRSHISAILDNSEDLLKEEDASTPDLSMESTSMDDILSEFLCTARNPLHLKWSRSAKTIKSFLIRYRSSMYSSGHDFLTYQKHQNYSCDKNIRSTEKVTVNSCSEIGRSVGRQKHRKDSASTATGIGLNLDSRIHSEQGSTGKKRKMRKDAKNTLPSNVNHLIINVPVESSYADKNLESKDGATGKSAGLCREQVSCFQPIEIGNKMIKSKGMVNGKKTAESGHNLSDGSTESKSWRRKKSSPASTNGSGKNKPGHLQKEDESCYSYPGALLLTFAPGVPLPSHSELISTFGKYGVVLESETELQEDTNCARIVFAKSTDAEDALNSSDKIGIFVPPNVSYRLHYLPPIACSPPTIPPLPYIRESLERMISTLNTTSTVKETGPSDAIKLDARENLVGDMEGLLKKVNTMLNGAPAVGGRPIKPVEIGGSVPPALVVC